MKHMFKLVDGPIDWYFCDSEDALNWLEWRHRSITSNKLLRMLPKERKKVLKGRAIGDVIADTKIFE